jgi:hypothetical protein
MLGAISIYRYPAIAAVFFVMGISLFATFVPQSAFSQSAGVPVTGYAWSDNIGWVDLNCANSGVCNTNPFGFSVNSTGNLSGYAWSDNIGWISANASDLVGCPQTPCTANIQGNSLTGWLKAIGADNNGWDGWISLNGSGYGVAFTSGNLAGWGWGSDVVGWLQFDASTTYDQCTATYSCTGSDSQTITYTNTSCQQSTVTVCTSPDFCSNGSSVCLAPTITFNSSGNLSGQLQVIPNIVQAGETSKVYWDVSNAQSCTVTGTNGDSWTGSFSGSNGTTTRPIVGQTIYALSCTGYADATPPSISEIATINITPEFIEK